MPSGPMPALLSYAKARCGWIPFGPGGVQMGIEYCAFPIWDTSNFPAVRPNELCALAAWREAKNIIAPKTIRLFMLNNPCQKSARVGGSARRAARGRQTWG